MTVFHDRLLAAVEVFRQRQSYTGGWADALAYDNATPAIVSTTHVLAMLRAAGVPYEDRAVQLGLRYIERSAKTHVLALNGNVVAGARGPHTRYVAFALLGLTDYPESLYDRARHEGQQTCVHWLTQHNRISGAWAEHPTGEHPSLISTQAAVVGLSRLRSVRPLTAADARLVTRARKAVRDMVDEEERQWWPLLPDWHASPASTALAVLALADGGEDDRELAIAGAGWLRRNASRWTTGGIEGDANARDTNWHHMTFSLAARAVLHPRFRMRADDEALRDLIGHLDRLWRDDPCGWSWLPGSAVTATATGSHAVVMAHEALGRAWPFDASRDILGGVARRIRIKHSAPGWKMVLGPERRVTLVDFEDRTAAQCTTSEEQFLLLTMLARAIAASGGSTNIEDRTVTAGALFDALPDIHQLDSLRKAVTRTNDALRDAGKAKGRSLGDFVQRMTVDKNWRDQLYGVAVATVEFE